MNPYPVPDNSEKLVDESSKISLDLVEKVEKIETNLPRDIDNSYQVEHEPELSDIKVDKSDDDVIKKTKSKCPGIKMSSVLDKKTLLFGNKTGKYTSSNMCAKELTGLNDGVEKDIPSLANNYNEVVYKARYGFQKEFSKEYEMSTQEKYLLMGYQEDMKPLERMGAFGTSNNSYAGYQEWMRNDPTEKRNLVTDYTSVFNYAD